MIQQRVRVVEIDITPSMQYTAINLSNHNGSDIVSAYGKTVVFDYLQDIKLEPEYDRNYDIKISDNTIGVKTQERTASPRPYTDYTLPVYDQTPPPSVFVFVSLLANGSTGDRRFGKAWVLGMIAYESLSKSFKLWKKGEVDSVNGWKASADCYKVFVRDLEPMI